MQRQEEQPVASVELDAISYLTSVPQDKNPGISLEPSAPMISDLLSVTKDTSLSGNQSMTSEMQPVAPVKQWGIPVKYQVCQPQNHSLDPISHKQPPAQLLNSINRPMHSVNPPTPWLLMPPVTSHSQPVNYIPQSSLSPQILTQFPQGFFVRHNLSPYSFPSPHSSPSVSAMLMGCSLVD